MTNTKKRSRKPEIALGSACVVIGALVSTVALSFTPGDRSSGSVFDGDMRVPYKGYLEIDGKPVFDTKRMTFSLYTSSGAGALPVWTETQSVTINRGEFAVALGAVNSINSTIYDAEKLYIGVDVIESSSQGDVTIALGGRQELTAAPYSVWTATTSDLNVARRLNVNGSVVHEGALNALGDLSLYTTTTIGGDATFSGASSPLTVRGDLDIGGATSLGALATDTTVSMGTSPLRFTAQGNEFQLRGIDAIADRTGIELRALTDPAPGEPLFRVLSSGFAERLRVEHNGVIHIDNHLRVDGATTLGDGDDTVTIDGNLDVTGAMDDFANAGIVNASRTNSSGSRSTAGTNAYGGRSRDDGMCGISRMIVDRHRSNDYSRCYVTDNGSNWRIRAEVNGRDNHKVDCSMRCFNW